MTLLYLGLLTGYRPLVVFLHLYQHRIILSIRNLRTIICRKFSISCFKDCFVYIIYSRRPENMWCSLCFAQDRILSIFVMSSDNIVFSAVFSVQTQDFSMTVLFLHIKLNKKFWRRNFPSLIGFVKWQGSLNFFVAKILR